MSIAEITDDAQWDHLVNTHHGHATQLSGWGAVKQAHGWQSHHVQIDGSDWAGAQILLRPLPKPFHSLAYIPRGGVGEWTAERYDELVDYCKQTYHSVCLMIEPAEPTVDLSPRWRASPNHIFIPQTLILDLTKSEDELMANIASKRRYDIRKSTKRVTEFSEITTRKDLDACLELYHQTAARAGFALHGDDYYIDIFTKCEGSSRIMAAWNDAHELLAFTWLLTSDQIAFELYSGISDEGQHLRANYGLKWWCITEMRRRGIKQYDFNGLLNDGISSFKRSFGNTEVTLAGSFDAPLSPYYTLYTRVLPLGKRLSRTVRSIIKR